MLFPFEPTPGPTPTAATGGLFGGSSMWFLLAIVAVMGVMMWFSSRTKKRQAAAEEEKRSNLLPGTEVVMRGGLYGTVVSTDEDSIIIESIDGSKTRWMKAAVGRIVEPEVEDDATDAQAGGPTSTPDDGEPGSDTPGYIKP